MILGRVVEGQVTFPVTSAKVIVLEPVGAELPSVPVFEGAFGRDFFEVEVSAATFAQTPVAGGGSAVCVDGAGAVGPQRHST